MALNFQKGVKLYQDNFKFKILPKYLSKPLSLKIQLYFYKFYEQFLFSFVDEITKVAKNLIKLSILVFNSTSKHNERVL